MKRKKCEERRGERRIGEKGRVKERVCVPR